MFVLVCVHMSSMFVLLCLCVCLCWVAYWFVRLLVCLHVCVCACMFVMFLFPFFYTYTRIQIYSLALGVACMVSELSGKWASLVHRIRYNQTSALYAGASGCIAILGASFASTEILCPRIGARWATTNRARIDAY